MAVGASDVAGGFRRLRIRIAAGRRVIIARLIGIDRRAHQSARQQPGAGANRGAAATRCAAADERASRCASESAETRSLARGRFTRSEAHCQKKGG